MSVWTCCSPSLFLTAVSNDPLQQDSTDGGLLLRHHCARPDPGHALQAGQCCWLQQGHVLGVGTKVCVYIPSPCSPQTHTYTVHTQTFVVIVHRFDHKDFVRYQTFVPDEDLCGRNFVQLPPILYYVKCSIITIGLLKAVAMNPYRIIYTCNTPTPCTGLLAIRAGLTCMSVSLCVYECVTVRKPTPCMYVALSCFVTSCNSALTRPQPLSCGHSHWCCRKHQLFPIWWRQFAMILAFSASTNTVVFVTRCPNLC